MASCHVMRSISRRPLAGRRLGGGEHGLADRGQHVVLVDEAHLGVELHELVLAVGAQVLVAQAAGDLVVAVDAGDHQQLLEQLRRLRQGVERPRLLARRHEELAGPLGRGRHEHRRLDLDEALRLHRPADRRVDAAADAQVALHALAPQVEVAVLQADVLVDLVGAGVDRERRRRGRAQHLDRAVADLDLAGRQVGVDGALRALADDAGDPHDVLAADVDGVVDDALHDAGVVADVDEGEVLAVLAPASHPAAHARPSAPTSSGRSSPHMWVRIDGGRARVMRSTRFQVGEEVGAGDDRSARRSTPAAGARRPCRRPARRRRRSRRRPPAAVGGLHLGLHAAPVVRPVGRAPGPPHLVGDHERLASAGGVDDEHVDRRVRRRRTRPRRRRPAACGRRRGRSRRRGSAGRRAPRRGRRSDRRRRARSGRRRACRRRTRTSCAGSSRGRAPAGGRCGTGCRARRARRCTAAKCVGRGRARGTRRRGARRRSAAASSGRFESRTRSGLRASVWRLSSRERVAVAGEVGAAAPRRSGPGRPASPERVEQQRRPGAGRGRA